VRAVCRNDDDDGGGGDYEDAHGVVCDEEEQEGHGLLRAVVVDARHAHVVDEHVQLLARRRAVPVCNNNAADTGHDEIE
jgi:hypothetical protein